MTLLVRFGEHNPAIGTRGASSRSGASAKSAAGCRGEKVHHFSIDNCIVTRYSDGCNSLVQPAGLEGFYKTGSKAGIQPVHASRLDRQLEFLNRATSPAGMKVPGWNLHSLQGELAGRWAVKVNANWRMTFRFEEEDAILLDYQDYH